MLRIVPARAFAVQLHQFHGDDHVTAALQARNDFADQTARDGIRFAKNQRPFDCHTPHLLGPRAREACTTKIGS